MGAFFVAPVSLVLAIAIMTTASFHFMRHASKQRTENKMLEAYLALCDAFDNVLHFICILSVFAFGYQYGLIEAVKLLVVCLVLPVVGHIFALIMGTNNWNRIASIIAMPIAVLCVMFLFPRLSWFGIL